jgi:hypothetical protein
MRMTLDAFFKRFAAHLPTLAQTRPGYYGALVSRKHGECGSNKWLWRCGGKHKFVVER